jgi:hypothetical protein
MYATLRSGHDGRNVRWVGCAYGENIEVLTLEHLVQIVVAAGVELGPKAGGVFQSGIADRNQ